MHQLVGPARAFKSSAVFMHVVMFVRDAVLVKKKTKKNPEQLKSVLMLK